MESNNLSFNIVSQQTDLELSRQALTETFNEEDSSSDNHLEDSFSTLNTLKSMHAYHIELIKLFEMQKNDTEKAAYEEQIDNYLKQLDHDFKLLLNKFSTPDNEVRPSLSPSPTKSDAFRKILHQKEKYMKLYNQQSKELSKALNFQRESIDALARLKVEFAEYKKNKEGDGVQDMSIVKSEIKEMFIEIDKKTKKSNSVIEAKLISLNSRLARLSNHINPDTCSHRSIMKNPPISVQELADLYDSNDDHSMMHPRNVSSIKFSKSKSNYYEKSQISSPYISSEQASIIDLQSKLRATRDLVLSEKNEVRLLKSKCETLQHEVNEWKKHGTALSNEYRDFKANAELEIEDLRSFITREKQNSQQLKNILSLLKDDNIKLLQSSQQYQETIANQNKTITKITTQKEELANRKSDLEEAIRSREEEISALYYQNNLRAIKINELSERIAEEDRELNVPVDPLIMSLEKNEQNSEANKGMLNFMNASAKMNEQAIGGTEKSEIVLPSFTIDKFISDYKELNSNSSNLKISNDYLEEAVEVLRAYAKESKALWNRIVK
jgi:chromosome segregation ATPase